METRQVVWPATGEVAVEEGQISSPKSDEVVLEADCTLISPGTERAFLLQLPNTSGKYPMYPGYNFVGTVVECGEEVDQVGLGTRVVASAAHASHVKIKAKGLIPVPEGLASETAAFFNMGAIVLQGVRRARIELGESVGVIGQGLIGLLAVQLARHQGGLPLIAVDPQDSRLELARRCGADTVVDPQQAGELERVVASLEGGGAAVVIEATGAPEPINTALGMARPDGRVVLLASTRGETEVNFYRDVHKKGLTVLGAHNGARPVVESRPGVWTWAEDCRTILDLLSLGRMQVDFLISHRFAAEEAPQAYELLKEWDPNLLGVVLQWRRSG